MHRRPATSPSRSGFTLIELMAVLLILIIIAGLTLGSIMRSRNPNRLLAAEHLIADAIRQVRHAARSSGSPVMLKISPVRRAADGPVTGGQLSGVSRICIWNETFDDGHDPTDTGFGFGMSGTARVVSQSSPWEPVTLTKNQLLLRGGHQDGFYLACAVRPGLAADPKAVKSIPLLLIGDSQDATTSTCGIMLVRSDIDAEKPRRALIQSGPQGKRAKMLCWEILGWVTGKDGQVFVSSFDNPPADRTNDMPKLPSENLDIAGPIGGDRWEEIGLMYTGDQLVLYRNGQRVGVVEKDVPRLLLPGAQIHLGEANIGVQAYAKCPVDDGRLYRLGTDQLGPLPQGIRPMADPSLPNDTAIEYRIVAHPEGRVELFSAIAQDPTEAIAFGQNTALDQHTGFIYLGGDFTAPGKGGERADSAQVSIAIDGRVSSRLVLSPPREAAQ
jgi:prepilin-type N-terminal cleavage/methylation domain-containing protein